MLKWIGCILVMTGCVGGGMVMAVRLKRRIRILEELEVLLQRLYGEMEYAGNDMIDILKILQVESIYFSELWQRIIERLERGDSVRL